MATPNTPKLRFNEFLEQKIEYRSGGNGSSLKSEGRGTPTSCTSSVYREHRGEPRSDISKEYFTSVRRQEENLMSFNEPEEQEGDDMEPQEETEEDVPLTAAGVWEAESQLKLMEEGAAETGELVLIQGVFKGKSTPVETAVRRSRRIITRQRREEEEEAQRQHGPYQMPLRMDDTTHREEYVAWKMQDLTALMEQLPSLHGGASAWLLQLQSLTSGVRLALGDMKALLARSTDYTTMNALINTAGLGKLGSATEPEKYRVSLWNELRRAYPTEKNYATLTSFAMEDGEQAAQYLDRAKTTWRSVHIEPHDQSGTTLSMWKEMVVNGTPIEVKTKLRATVGLMALPTAQFNSHVHHHISQYNKDKGTADSQVQSLQLQLLKLQLNEAQKTAKQKKQMMAEEPTDIAKIQTMNQMLVAAPAPPTPPQAPVVYAAPPNPGANYGYEGYIQPGFSNPSGPTWGGPPQARRHCYNCYQEGHYARICPAPLSQHRQYYLAYRGRRGGQRGRGAPRYPAPAQGYPPAPAQGYPPAPTQGYQPAYNPAPLPVPPSRGCQRIPPWE
ncbi:uncharacterized protein LOC121846702 [Oncorhynchus tshawytscha]|uniref:uncharacterized protein LOC121846702 n=1 Tax=Oncorhynchus tshawytscha TaxID=74940 RepID=UPI001C3CC8CF|nr:uncharacterized protein LOC121846702 [Oncorhynchus tshawytscha]